MTLTLYMHPLASFCHKVLIGLYENETPFTPVTIDFADEGTTVPLLARWPVGKIPVLHDADRNRTVPETSIILEYLHHHYPGPVPLFPDDPSALLDVRLSDRFFDLYVSAPLQKIVLDRIRPDDQKDPAGLAEAGSMLQTAYGMLETNLRGHRWAVGDRFSLADCSAGPALFYASIVMPFAPDQVELAAYFERLMARPSVVRVIDEARPWFGMFPYRDAMPERFLLG